MQRRLARIEKRQVQIGRVAGAALTIGILALMPMLIML